MKTIAILLFISLSNVLLSQNIVTDTTAEVVAYWKKGDFRLLEKTTTREKYVNDAMVFKTTSTSDIVMKVVEETEANYQVEWIFKDTRVSETEEEIVKRITELTKDFKTVYKLSNTGMYEGIVNYEEMQNYFLRGLELMKDKYGTDTMGKQVFGIIKQIFETRETAEAGFGKEIQLYHFPYGAEYTLNQEVNEQITLPNPFTGDPIQAYIKFKMTDLDIPKMTCRIEGTMSITEEDSKKFIKDFIQKLKEKGADKIPAESDIPPVIITDTYVHDIELLNGWVTNVKYVRSVKSGIVTQVDTTSMQLKNP